MARVTDFSDSFTRADNADLGADYTVDGTRLDLVSNAVRASVTGGSEVLGEICTGITLPADQWAQITVASLATTHDEMAVGVRSNTTNTAYFSIARNKAAGAEGARIAKVIAGVFTTLANATETWAANDVMRVEVVGTDLELFKNDVSILSAADGAIAGGDHARLGIYADSVISSAIADGFSAGHFSTASRRLVGGRLVNNSTLLRGLS